MGLVSLFVWCLDNPGWSGREWLCVAERVKGAGEWNVVVKREMETGRVPQCV